MSGFIEETKPSKCAVCDTYNLKGMWKCKCDAMNVSKRVTCWKCGIHRSEDQG